MTPAEIAALRALCDAATPGPWGNFRLNRDTKESQAAYVAEAIERGTGPFMMVLNSTEDADVCHTGNGPTSDANARFIAAARTAVPALLSALEEATKERSTFDRVGADRLADEVAVLVRRGTIDARSPAGDALLDYRDPPSTPRADRLASLESALEEARAEVERLTKRSDEMADALKWERVAFEARRVRLEAAEARADALQAEVENLRAGICYAVKNREKETARADAAWRAALEAAALVVYPSGSHDEPSAFLRAALAGQIRSLPPPSATPNEET